MMQDSNNIEKSDYDLVIVGAGIIGLTVSLITAKHGLSVCLMDHRLSKHRQGNFESTGSQKSWVSAVARPAQKILKNLGVWDKLKMDSCAYKEMQVEMQNGSVLNFSCMDVGEDNLGYIVNNFQIKHELMNLCQNEKNIKMVCDEPKDWSLESGKMQTKKGQVLHGKLLIGADGVNSWARKMAKIGLDKDDHINDQAWVGLLRHKNGHRDIARQKFFQDGVVGLLPTVDPLESVMVWSQGQKKTDDEEIDNMKGVMIKRINQFFPDMGHLMIEGDLILHKIESQGAKQYYRDNVVLVGDCATSVHPLAGQGLNLGLRSAGILADELKKAQSANLECATEYHLKRYTSRCEGFDALSRRFFVTCRSLGATEISKNFTRWGVFAVNNIQWLREMFIRHALYADVNEDIQR